MNSGLSGDLHVDSACDWSRVQAHLAQQLGIIQVLHASVCLSDSVTQENLSFENAVLVEEGNGSQISGEFEVRRVSGEGTPENDETTPMLESREGDDPNEVWGPDDYAALCPHPQDQSRWCDACGGFWWPAFHPYAQARLREEEFWGPVVHVEACEVSGGVWGREAVWRDLPPLRHFSGTQFFNHFYWVFLGADLDFRDGGIYCSNVRTVTSWFPVGVFRFLATSWEDMPALEDHAGDNWSEMPNLEEGSDDSGDSLQVGMIGAEVDSEEEDHPQIQGPPGTPSPQMQMARVEDQDRGGEDRESPYWRPIRPWREAQTQKRLIMRNHHQHMCQTRKICLNTRKILDGH